MVFGESNAQSFVGLFNQQRINYKNLLTDLYKSIKIAQADYDAADFKFTTFNNQLKQLLEAVQGKIATKYGQGWEWNYFNNLKYFLGQAGQQGKDNFELPTQLAFKKQIGYDQNLPDDSPFWAYLAELLEPIKKPQDDFSSSVADRGQKYSILMQDNYQLNQLKGEIQGWLVQANQYADALGKIPSYEELWAEAQSEAEHPIVAVTPPPQPTAVSLQPTAKSKLPMIAAAGIVALMFLKKKK